MWGASVLLVLAGFISRIFSREIVVVRQDSQMRGFVENIDVVTGKVTMASETNFVFDWPLVEMTTDLENEVAYIITYPEGYPGAVLYQFDNKLNLIKQWDDQSFSYFDLQYSTQQKTLFGILVTSSYGRTLSNFALTEDEVIPTELFTLPYMWYVNASSFDHSTNTFFALINNFPGFENSTLDQQLIVADFTNMDGSDVAVLPISSADMLVQFIAYSSKMDTLFSSGMSNGTIATIAVMNLDGVTSTPFFTVAGVAMGPLIADEVNSRILTFVESSYVPSTWELWAIPYNTPADAKVIQTYTGDAFNSFASGNILIN